MYLPIACPTIPPGAEGKERWGFDQLDIRMSHHLGKSGDQISSHPLQLDGDLIKPMVKYLWAHILFKTKLIPHLPHPLLQGGEWGI